MPYTLLVPSRVWKGADNMSASVVEARGARSMPYMFLPEIVGVLLFKKKKRGFNNTSAWGWFFVPVVLTQ